MSLSQSIVVERFKELENRRLLELLRIYEACFSGPPRHEHFDQDLIREEFESSSRKGATFLFATSEDDRLIGYALSIPLIQSELCDDLIVRGADPSSHYLSHLAVSPEFQNSGLGRRLLRKSIDTVTDSTSMVVRCRADIPNMLGLLKSEGFRIFASYEASTGGSWAERFLLVKEIGN